MALVVPDIRQHLDHSCGDTAIEVVRRYWGRRATLPLLANTVLGVPPEAIALALREDGFVVLSGEMDTDDLRDFTRRGRPVIAATGLFGGHWTVVTGVWRHFVHFHCPSDGPRRLRIADWQRTWADGTVSGFRYRQWGICPWLMT